MRSYTGEVEKLLKEISRWAYLRKIDGIFELRSRSSNELLKTVPSTLVSQAMPWLCEMQKESGNDFMGWKDKQYLGGDGIVIYRLIM